MKSPFNWVGNKHKFMEKVNSVVSGKHYSAVFDLFLGSGNILLNLGCTSDRKVGNDIQRLIPMTFGSMKSMDAFSIMEVEDVLERNERFSTKDSYYNFRDAWNGKYTSSSFSYDRNFVLETALLLKMCSNSMVRFNNSGVFNQGFRGLGRDSEFFKQSMLYSIVKQLNKLLCRLQSGNFKFTALDFKDFLFYNCNDALFILDPPYTLGDKGMYNQNFSLENELALLEFIERTNGDFIFFNYIQHGKNTFQNLEYLLFKKDFRVIDIGDNNVSAGQGGKKDKYVREVLVTNIHL